MVAAEAITVGDDVHHPLSVGIGFDFEGVPKERVAVIEGGRASRPVTDLKTSKLLPAPLSGHYSGSGEFGPYPFNIVMEPGDSSREQLIASVDDGLLIGRFHYVNVLDRPSALLTGMTRDGIWRISRGEVTNHVNNLRFTQSVLDVLRSTVAVGRDLESFAPDYGGFGSNVAPALRCTDFSFTSTTSH
jgi:PmbA protein